MYRDLSRGGGGYFVYPLLRQGGLYSKRSGGYFKTGSEEASMYMKVVNILLFGNTGGVGSLVNLTVQMGKGGGLNVKEVA